MKKIPLVLANTLLQGGIGNPFDPLSSVVKS